MVLKSPGLNVCFSSPWCQELRWSANLFANVKCQRTIWACSTIFGYMMWSAFTQLGSTVEGHVLSSNGWSDSLLYSTSPHSLNSVLWALLPAVGFLPSAIWSSNCKPWNAWLCCAWSCSAYRACKSVAGWHTSYSLRVNKAGLVKRTLGNFLCHEKTQRFSSCLAFSKDWQPISVFMCE